MSLNITESKVETIFGPGDCIGDVEIVENCYRTHTFITTSHCELLIMFKHDFTPILKPFMDKLWDDKKKALKALDYFTFLDEEQVVSACRVGTLKQFEPLETIYSEDKGSLTNVHFVLSGECVILQCINMKLNLDAANVLPVA
ncbi:uncharacterized protein LOC115629547 [Scaptodrosophila lebanonensis]|uniref:Uncharacterized protein LOC115629547 n=1 Tax=Drosophila lebanonensis TaxID=7225 RepID=A0A6J2U336_DROLE|nr:uncharacterized protein LOC115629547 [Scaptodrosophila lebanonensis]